VNTLPTIELLESTHTFPGRYVWKVIGRAEGGFIGRVVAAVRDQLDAAVDPPYRVRETAGGRHVAVTLEPEVASAWEVLAVYGRIQEIDGLVLLL